MNERPMPSSEEAERAVLGAILLDNESFFKARSLLQRDDFYASKHRLIFECMSSLVECNSPVDLVTVTEELSVSGEIESVGGSSYISALTDGLPRSSNVGYYCEIVKDKSLRRKLITQANGVLVDAYEGQSDTRELLERSENEIIELATEHQSRGFVSFMDIAQASQPAIERILNHQPPTLGLETGYRDLDHITYGLQNKELTIIAARPSMGKTALALNIAEHIAIDLGKPVGIFSLEMGREELFMRSLSSQARVSSFNMRSGFVPSHEFNKLTTVAAQLASAPIYVDDSSVLTIAELHSKSRQLQKEHGIVALFLDYIQLMTAGFKTENRTQEVSAVGRALKRVAKDLSIPVVALSQLSRKPEDRRKDHKPILSDLRESGSLEQDADSVYLLWREEMYKKTEENAGLAELRVGKNRNGPVGEVKLAFLQDYTRFETMAGGE